MSTQAHTPGPWRIDPRWTGDIQTDDGQLEIGAAFGKRSKRGTWRIQGEVPSDAEQDANARLIAAAPDMLAALSDAADYIKDLDGGDIHTETGWKSDELCAVWAKCRDAIAKAEGR